MQPRRYLSTHYVYAPGEFDVVEPDAARHMPGEWQRGERMSLDDVKRLIQHAARHPENWEPFDFPAGPGIQLIHRPIANPESVTVTRILGITIDKLPIDLFSGGY